VKKVRNSTARAGRGKSVHEDRGAPLILALGWSRRDVAGVAVGALATIAILLNVLFMQSGSHPAPMFRDAFVPPESAKAAPVRTKPVEVVDSAPAVVPRPRPADPAPAAPATKVAAPAGSRMPGEIISDIQRELVRRGYYDGVVDGLYGPKTDAAIRDFEQAAGLQPSAEPNDVLLTTITRSNVKAQPAAAAPSDPIAALLAPSARIVAVQRALTDFGYGPVKPSGTYDAATRTAIERFEKARHRPQTGQISDQLVRDLSALTGRPIE